jgi:hypothetical protein
MPGVKARISGTELTCKRLISSAVIIVTGAIVSLIVLAVLVAVTKIVGVSDEVSSLFSIVVSARADEAINALEINIVLESVHARFAGTVFVWFVISILYTQPGVLIV